jgi:hypothetical protein
VRFFTYIERKLGTVQSQVRRVVAALQLPEGVLPHAMHAFEKLFPDLEKIARSKEFMVAPMARRIASSAPWSSIVP